MISYKVAIQRLTSETELMSHMGESELSTDRSYLLTIGISAYNLQDEIIRCMESVAEAVADNDVEVLIINDGSSDDTPKLIDSFCESRPNWIPVHKENGGLGSVRNTCIDLAKGTYIWFIDGDDTIAKRSVEILLDLISSKDFSSKKVDMVIFDYLYCNDTDNSESTITVPHMHPALEALPQNRITKTRKIPELLLSYPSSCNRIIRKSALVHSEVKFIPRMYYEDLNFAARFFPYVLSFYYLPQSLYRYYYRPDSIMNATDVKRNADLIKVFDRIIADLKQDSYFDYYKNEVEYLCLSHILLSAALRIYKIDKKAPLMKDLRNYLKTVFPEWHKNPYFKQLSFKRRMLTFSMYYGFTPPLFFVR